MKLPQKYTQNYKDRYWLFSDFSSWISQQFVEEAQGWMYSEIPATGLVFNGQWLHVFHKAVQILRAAMFEADGIYLGVQKGRHQRRTLH